MNESMTRIQSKLETLQKKIDTALEKWAPLQEDCDSEWIKDVKGLKVTRTPAITSEEILKIETALGYQLPESYVALVTMIGSFDIGKGELLVHQPSRIKDSLGSLIETEMPDNSLDNLKEGHYHDFIILSEYGHFPQQDLDDSSGVAFNKKNPNEIIEYANDKVWLASTPEKRESENAHGEFLAFIEKKLDALLKRAKEPTEGLLEEITFYENQE